MKKIYCALISLGSAGVASLLTYIFTKKHLENTYQYKLEKRCEGCIYGTRAHHSSDPKDYKWDGEDPEKDWEEAVKEQLNKYRVGNFNDEVKLDTENAPTEEEISEDDISLDPYVCTDEEFMNSEEKAYFTVYQDGVIADDKDKVIRNAAYYLGDDILNTLTAQGDDPLYVRNPVLNIAIEIGFSLEDYGA